MIRKLSNVKLQKTRFPRCMDFTPFSLTSFFSCLTRRSTDKLGILDIVAELNDNTKINIEMQVENCYDVIDRSLFYQSGLYHESLKKGVPYNNSFKTIGIWITNYDVFKTGYFHEIARSRRDYENIILTDKFELHYIQLTKFKAKCKRISTKLDQWITFIINEKLEEIKMVDNKYIKKQKKN